MAIQNQPFDTKICIDGMRDKLCLFLAELRRLGYSIGVSEARDALMLGAGEGGLSRPLFQSYLQHLLCSNKDEWEQFDRLFHLYFYTPEEGDGAGSNPDTGERFDKQFNQDFQIVADFYHGEEGDQEGGAGRDKAVSATDFRFLTEQTGWEEAAKLAEYLAQQIKLRQTRRWRKTSRGKRIDLATTARKLAATDGDPLIIGRKQRKRRPLHIIALLDVSHSMSYYSPMLARFVRGLLQSFEHSEAFCFHIELNCVTDILKETDRETMRQRMEAFENLWFGGTNIAGSLAKFNQQYLQDIATKNTVVLLFSDGCDTSSAQELMEPLAAMRKQVRRVFWINPMQARLQRGGLVSSSPLMAGKSYIDGQISGDSLRSLASLARTLSR